MKPTQLTGRTISTAAQIALLACLSVTLLVVSAIMARIPPAEADTHFAMRNISYTTGGGPSQKLDLYVPVMHSNQPVPLIIWIHGGGWNAGDKSDAPIAEIEKRGYAAASINYRLSTEAPFPAQVDDCRAAINCLKAQSQRFHIDPKKIGLWGESSGGHLAMLAGATASSEKTPEREKFAKVQAICDWGGPTDLFSISSQAKAPGQRFFTGRQGQVALLLGGPPEKNLAKAAQASPVQFVTKDWPPILIVHGQLDGIVPQEQSVELASKLQDVGAKAKLVILPGRAHSFGAPDTWSMALDFFDSVLKHNATK